MSQDYLENLPITSDQARSARNYFAWSQAQAAEESGLPLHKLKRFEAGNGKGGVYTPDPEFLHALRAFYERQGFRFDDTEEPGSAAKKDGLVFPAGVVGATQENQGATSAGKPVKASFHHMRIALAEPEMGHVLDLIEQNEEQAKRLLAEPVEAGLLDRFSDKTEALHGEVTRLMAANGMLFAKLFGRDVGGKPTPGNLDGSEKIKNQAQLLHRVHADTHMAASGDSDAKDRLATRKPARTLASALFG